MKIEDTVILKIGRSKKKAFLEMLERQWLDFIEVQSQDSVLQRFVKNSPKDIPLTYEDLAAVVMANRYDKK